MKKVTKVIIPAAGLGTRFLPQTKAMPKEMLPIIDKPVIQYVVEEAVSAGITDVIIVNGAHKRAIEDHFDHQYELEEGMRQKGKTALADQLAAIADMANFVYVRQKGPKGNGVPVLNAAHLVGDEPVLVLFADDIFKSEVPRAVQLIKAYENLGKSVISAIKVEGPAISQYGVMDIKQKIDDCTFRIAGVVEKPEHKDAPSEYAAISGYVLTPDIFPILRKLKPDASGEVYLSTAINELAQTDEVYACLLDGTWYDTGNKERYLETVVEMALADPELSKSFREYLKGLLT